MPEGPFIQLATFCESVTRSEDGGNMTVHKCVTRLVVQPPAGPIPAGALISVPIEGLTFALSMWAGQLKGRYELAVSAESPDGTAQELHKQTIDLGGDGEADGLDLTFSFPLALALAGIYWFSISIEGADVKRRRIARVPLGIEFVPTTVAAEPFTSAHASHA